MLQKAVMTDRHYGYSLHSADGSYAATVKRFWPFIWPKGRPDLKFRVSAALFALLIAKVIVVLIPFSYKGAVDALTGLGAVVTPGQLALVPMVLVIAYGVGRVSQVFFEQLRDGLFAKVGQNAVRNLANQTFRHLHELSLRFHLERRTGGLNRIIERGTKGVEIILRFSLFNTIPTTIEVTLVTFIMFYHFGWLFALVIWITMTAYVGFTYQTTEWRIGIRRQMNDADTESNTKAVDSLLNYETVKYFGSEAREQKRFDKSMKAYERAAVKNYTSLAVLNAGQALIFTTGLTTCMWLAARGVAAGTMTVGDFVMVNAYLIQLYQPLHMLGFVYREVKQGLIDIETMFNLMDVEVEVKDDPGAKPLVVAEGRISFENVSFAYESARPILHDLSFEVPAGKTVAIVGPSGAGKSTISRLLYRFYEVTGGAVKIDGQDIAKVTQNSLRAAIGMVPQDTVLFNDTIGYNIAYGRDDATLEEIHDAAKLAQIHDFIGILPEGYDAMVGERGLKLSGGEKQRVAIARTILKGPPILLLDEATSALDSYTEKEIQDALDQVSQNRTTLVIAHRLSTVIGADEIIVMNKGQIAERGTHSVLLEKHGLYAGLWKQQREAELTRERLAAEQPTRGKTAEELELERLALELKP
jgi:ATP-binding cassette, subfamily B, heavy metal transporter